MVQVKKTIGKLPVHKGAWVSGTAYAKLNQVTHEGSCLQSKVDNNTATPITIDMLAGTFTVHANWQLISDGTTAKIAAQKATEATDQIAANIMTRQSVFHGLGFKSGDNTVNLKTPKINLGHDDFTLIIWARMEGCANDMSKALLTGGANKMGIYGTVDSANLNTISLIRFMKDNAESLIVNKVDSTKNEHLFIVKRQGARFVLKVNNRLTKEVIHDRVLDFSEFQPDIANTSYFSSLRLLNFYTDDGMDDQLWYGGRCDEVGLDSSYLSKGWIQNIDYTTLFGKYNVIEQTTTSLTLGKYTEDGGSWGYAGVPLVNKTFGKFKVKCKVLSTFDTPIRMGIGSSAGTINNSINVSAKANQELVIDCIINVPNNNTNAYFTFGIIKSSIIMGNADTVKFYDTTVTDCECLLELLPQNIHSTGIYNSGSLGSSHDATLSKPNETIFHRERPYKDKQMVSGAPSFHPIAMGQECTDQVSGSIYKASVPPVGREWAVSDWKQINNA